MAAAGQKKFDWKVCVALLVVLAGLGAVIGWYKFFREEPQPDWVTATPDMRFKYGSIGAENDVGAAIAIDIGNRQRREPVGLQRNVPL